MSESGSNAAGARSGRRKTLSPLFIAAVVVLVAAGLGLQPAIAALIDYYSKASIEPRRSLTEFDFERLESFRVLEGIDGYTVGPDVGTEEYATAALADRDDPRRRAALLVTYYSDPRDQVPHTPEVCYVQAGGTITERRTVAIPTPYLAPETPQIEARLLHLTTDNVKEVLVYFFYCNGRPYLEREEVRWAIGFPGDKAIYFSKVEAVSTYDSQLEAERATELCVRLLAETMHVLADTHFPTATDVAR